MSRKDALGPAVSVVGDEFFDEMTTPANEKAPRRQRQPRKARPKKTAEAPAKPRPEAAAEKRGNLPANGHVRTSLDLSEDLHRRLRLASVEERTPMAEILRASAEEWLRQHGH